MANEDPFRASGRSSRWRAWCCRSKRSGAGAGKIRGTGYGIGTGREYIGRRWFSPHRHFISFGFQPRRFAWSRRELLLGNHLRGG